jgi:hypothetical protein
MILRLKLTLIILFNLVVFEFHSQGQLPKKTSNNIYKNPENIVSSDNFTFKSSRIVNGHSPEVIKKNSLLMKIDHRFGDIAGGSGGLQNLFGLDNSSDIRIGFDYGITDNLNIGIGRSKGTGNPYRSLVDGFVKYQFFNQFSSKIPITVTGVLTSAYTYMIASSDISKVSHFPKWQHRLSYSSQLLISRKFGNRWSVNLAPTLVHRNYVSSNDVNTLFALGSAIRFKVNDGFALIGEYYHSFSNKNFRSDYANSLSFAMEFNTYGHIFTVLFANSQGLGESQFIPYTFDKWLKGQFRLGFCIERNFNFNKNK